MRTQRLAIALIAGTIFLSGCATSIPASDLDAGAERAQIDGVRNQFMTAMAEVDLATLGAIVHPEFIQVAPGGPQHLEMLAATKGPLPPGYRIEITPIELVVIDEEWAYEFGTSVQSWQPEDGGERIEIPNSYLMLLRKVDGAWKPYREVASALPPPGGWPEVAD